MRAKAAAQAELLATYRARQQLRQQMDEEALRDKIRQQQAWAGEGWAQQDTSAADGWHSSRAEGQAQAALSWLRVVQRHEQQWAALEAGSSSGGLAQGTEDSEGCSSASLGLADVPWPPLGSSEYLAGLAALEQQEAAQQLRQHPCGKRQQLQSTWPRAQRRAYARACLRWHPDKFEARWGRRLEAGDRAAVLARVQEVSQGINAAWEQLQQEGVG